MPTIPGSLPFSLRGRLVAGGWAVVLFGAACTPTPPLGTNTGIPVTPTATAIPSGLLVQTPLPAPSFPSPRPVGPRLPEPVISGQPTPEPIVSLAPGASPTIAPSPLASVNKFDKPELSVNVTTAHGNGTPGRNDGDNTGAKVDGAVGVSVSSTDIMAIADTNNHLIRKGSPNTGPDGLSNRTVEILAGSTRGFADGLAFSARFDTPTGVAWGPGESVYIADSGNNRIRRVVKRTVAGSAVDVVETMGGSGKRGHHDAVGTEAEFAAPWGVCVDKDGNAYVTDTGNHCIRKITPAKVITTVAGTPGIAGNADGAGKDAAFRGPKGIEVDSFGNLYVVDAGNQTVRKISASGKVTTLAGTAGSSGFVNGVGALGLFNNPTGLGLLASGDLLVADEGNRRIRRVTQKGEVTVLGGDGTLGDKDGAGTLSSFASIQDIGVDPSGDVYIADAGGHTIRKVLFVRVVTTLLGNGGRGGLDGANATFNTPWGMAADGQGGFIIADAGNHTIRRATAAGVVTTLAGSQAQAGFTDGQGRAARFDSPRAVAVAADGTIYVADTNNHCIRLVAADGSVLTFAGDGKAGFKDGEGATAQFNFPRGLAFDTRGNLVVADSGNHRIRAITPTGLVTTVAGDGTVGYTDESTTKARFAYPTGVAVDAKGTIYIADFGNNAIRAIAADAAGAKVGTLAGSGAPGFKDDKGNLAKFNNPTAVVVDADGFVYVADSGNSLIRRINGVGETINYAGSISSDLGEPISGYSDGAGSTARFAVPTSLVRDANGYVYVVDSENHCIRKIH